METHKEFMQSIERRLAAIEELLLGLTERPSEKEWYTTIEAAKILGKRPFTVREWCRLGRIKAEKRQAGRGFASEWMISHAELTRIQNEGLFPVPKNFARVFGDD